MKTLRSDIIPYVKIDIADTVYTFVHPEDIEVFPISDHTIKYNLDKRPVIGYTGGFFYDFAGTGFSIVNPPFSDDSIFQESDGTWPPSRAKLYNTEIGFFPENNDTQIFLGQSRVLSWTDNKGIPMVKFKVQPLNPIDYKLFNGDLQTDYQGQTQGSVFTIGNFKNAPAVVESATSETILFNQTGADPDSGIIVYNNGDPIAVTNPSVEEVSLGTNCTAFLDMTASSDSPEEDDQDSWETRDYISNTPGYTIQGTVYATNQRPDEPSRVGGLKTFLNDNSVSYSTADSTDINASFTVGRHILKRKFLARNLYVTDDSTSDLFDGVVVNQLVGLSTSGSITGGNIYSSDVDVDIDDTVTTNVHRTTWTNNNRPGGGDGQGDQGDSDLDNDFEIRTNVTDNHDNTDFEVNQLYSTIGSQFTRDLTSAVNIFDNDVVYYKYKESNFTLDFGKDDVTVDTVFNPDGSDITGDNSNSTWINSLFQAQEIPTNDTSEETLTNPSWTRNRGNVTINFSDGTETSASVKEIVMFDTDVRILLDTATNVFGSKTVSSVEITAATVSLIGDSPIITGAHNVNFTIDSTVDYRYYYKVEMNKPIFFYKTFYEYQTERSADEFYYRVDAFAGQVGGLNYLQANDFSGDLGDLALNYPTDQGYNLNQVNNEDSFSALNYYPRIIDIGTSVLSSKNINDLIESVDGGDKLRVKLLTENNIGNVTLDGVSKEIPSGKLNDILEYVTDKLVGVSYEQFPNDPIDSVEILYDDLAMDVGVGDFVIGSAAFTEVFTFKEILSKIAEWSGLQFGYTFSRTSSGLKMTINCNFAIGSTYDAGDKTYSLDEFVGKPNPTQNMIPEILLASTIVNVKVGSNIEQRTIVVQFDFGDFVLPTELTRPIGGETIMVEHLNNEYVSTNQSDDMRTLLQGKFEQMSRPSDKVTIPGIDLDLIHGTIIECDSDVLGVTETYRIVGVNAIDTENKQMTFTVEVIKSRPLAHRR